MAEEKVQIEIEVDEDDAVRSVDNLTESIGKSSKEMDSFGESTKKAGTDIKAATAALDNFIPGLGGAVNGIKGMATASRAFIATGFGAIIAAIGLAIAGLIEYFRGSEEGQNKWNKVLAVGSALMEQFKNVLETVGEVLVGAFENPQKAMQDFWKLLKENIVNRFEGLLLLIPRLGESIGLLFEGKFGEAGKVAFDAVAQVATGVENMSDKVTTLFNQISEQTQKAIEDGKRLADLQASIDKNSRELALERAKTELEISELKEKAAKTEGETRKGFLEEILRLQDGLSAKEVELAKQRLRMAELNKEIGGSDKKALEEVNNATIALIQTEKARYDQTLAFKKQIAEIEKKESEEREKYFSEVVEQNEKKTQDDVKGLQDRVARELAERKRQDKLAEDKKKKDKKDAEEAEKIKNKALKDGFNDSLRLAETFGAADRELALARIAVDTAEAISALTAASEANPANALTFGGAGIAQFAAGLIRISANIASAVALLNSGNPSGVSGGGAFSPDATLATGPRLGQGNQTTKIEFVFSEFRNLSSSIDQKEFLTTA